MAELELNIDVYKYINPKAFITYTSYVNAINTFKEKGYGTLDILMMSRFTYNRCEDVLLDDKTYDYILRFHKYNYLSKVPYEEDDYQKYIPVLKSVGLRINKIEYGDMIEENPVSDDIKRELFNTFSLNTSMMTLTNKMDIRNMYIEAYKSNFNRRLNSKTDNMGALSEDKYKRYAIQPFQQVITGTFKHDGWNITAYYIPEQTKIAYAHTRGRDGAEVRDCTFLLKDILPEMQVNEATKVVMELVLTRNNLEYLRNKYIDKSWVNIRNSVSTFVAGQVDKSDFGRISYKAFNIINSETSKMTLPEKIVYLQSHGFEVPYMRLSRTDRIDELIEDMEEYYEETYSQTFECDGLVLNMDFIDWYQEDDTRWWYEKVGSAMCAYKGDIWDSEIFEAEIEEIYMGRSKKQFTPKAKLKPVTSRSGSVITNVGLNNLRLIQKYWLMPGDKIKIKYHSQQIVLFVDKISGADRDAYIKENKDNLILEK